MLTLDPAQFYSLNDRGLLSAGKKADINVIDIDRVEERQPQRVLDLLGGFPRLIQRAAGYKNTIVNGKITLEDNELTDERGGTVIRGNFR